MPLLSQGSLSPDRLRAELASRHLKDFIEFTKPDYSFNWHHERMCQKVDDFVNGKIKKLLIFAPPQHGKSEVTTRRAPAYILGKDPRLRLAVISATKELAMAFNRDIQRIIDDKEYHKVFPETYLNKSNVVSNSKSKYVRNATMFETVPYKGSVRTVGIKGQLTGFPVDVAIFDDLYKDRSDALSRKHQQNVRNFWDYVLIPRLHNDSKIMGTFTRWSEDDLGGFLMETDTGWTVVSLPAIKDKEDPADPRKMGEALWPERHSLERLLDIKKKSPITFVSLYQQRPQAPNEVKVFRYHLIDEIPKHIPVGRYYYGVDFGYSNDPTCILQMADEIKGGLQYVYLNEVVYKTRMLNEDIKKSLVDRKINLLSPFYADRDPKDIAELRRLGINFIGARKGDVAVSIADAQDGVMDFVEGFDANGKPTGKREFKETRIFITKGSYSTIRDFDNFQWETFNGTPINVPVKKNKHAPDAFRYGRVTKTKGVQGGSSATAYD